MENLLFEHVDFESSRKSLKNNRLFRCEIACQREIKLDLFSVLFVDNENTFN